MTSVAVRQYTQDVRGCQCVSVCVRVCPSAHTGRCGCPSAHIGRPCVSVSTHRTSVAVSVTHRTSVGVRQQTQDVRHTQDVRGCPCVSMCVRQHTQDVRGCPSVHISARWSLKSAHWPFPWTVRVILAHVGCLFSTHRTSVSVRQHIQDVRVCPSAHTGRPWLSVC
ncbi:unnamed protein product, partial [Brassica rapa]